MTLPPNIVAQVVDNGWAELHPLAGSLDCPGISLWYMGRVMGTNSLSSRIFCRRLTITP
jgi:hypothetical protein